MAVTNLFEIGHFPYKIVEFTTFSMKQVCKPKKEAIFMLTLSSAFAVFGPLYGPMHNIFSGPIKNSIKAFKIVISKISEDRAFHWYFI